MSGSRCPTHMPGNQGVFVMSGNKESTSDHLSRLAQQLNDGQASNDRQEMATAFAAEEQPVGNDKIVAEKLFAYLDRKLPTDYEFAVEEAAQSAEIVRTALTVDGGEDEAQVAAEELWPHLQ